MILKTFKILLDVYTVQIGPEKRGVMALHDPLISEVLHNPLVTL